jgi:hypothetical protein
MDLINFLLQFLASDQGHISEAAGAVGLFVFGLIEVLDRAKPGLLSSNFKFWLSIALALFVPAAALVGLTALGQAAITPNTVYLALAVGGWAVSQIVHRGVEQVAPAKNSNGL